SWPQAERGANSPVGKERPISRPGDKTRRHRFGGRERRSDLAPRTGEPGLPDAPFLLHHRQCRTSRADLIEPEVPDSELTKPRFCSPPAGRHTKAGGGAGIENRLAASRVSAPESAAPQTAV